MKTIITTFLLLVGILANAQSPWLWGNSNGGVQGAVANGICIDASGNVYVTGSFQSPVVIFGKDTLVNVDTSGNTTDIYLVKYDGSGDVVWAASAGGVSNDVGISISADATGNVYIAGYFTSDSLGAVLFGTDTLTSDSYQDFFVAKYNSSGNIVWARTGDTSISINNITTDIYGNINITGSYYDSAIVWGPSTLINAGANDAFVARYDSLGNEIWATGIGGPGNETGTGISADTKGNTYVTGGYYSPAINIVTTALINAGGQNIFTVKYNAAGNAMWAKSAGGVASDISSAISADAQGNVYITGNYTSPAAAFGADTLVNIPYDSAATTDVFTAKYDSSGNVAWARGASSINNNVEGYAAAINASNNGYIYVTGGFYNPDIIFGNDEFTVDVPNGEDIFIVKYDASGNFIWATSLGNTAEDSGYTNIYDQGNGICTDNNGNVYVAGKFSSPVLTLDSITLTNAAAAGTDNMFVAKLNGTVTGIANPPNPVNTITLYPNPSPGQFYFKGVNSGSTLEIYNVLGQNIYSTTVTGQMYLLNISNNAKGMYFYRVVDGTTAVQEGKIILD